MNGDRQGTVLSGIEDVSLSREEGLDAMAIELATGLSLSELGLIGSKSPPQIRAGIAAKFARDFDRLAKGAGGKLTIGCLGLLAKDPERLVRMKLADGLKSSSHLPPDIARRLADDEIEIAAPILRHSPVLGDEFIAGIIESKSESHALAVAERRPLGKALVDHLVVHKGTKRVVIRLIENNGAELSDAILLGFREWGRADKDIAHRLQRRPNLPFAFINQGIIELAESVNWPSLGRRMMTKFEATQMQIRFEGRAGHRHPFKGGHFRRLHRELRENFEKGLLKPSSLLAFLRSLDIDRLESGFAVMTGLDMRLVRSLLHGSDRRGLIALCLKAEFGVADYLAFRMALSLAELGAVREEPEQRYREETMKFARDQFETMRANPRQLERWLALSEP